MIKRFLLSLIGLMACQGFFSLASDGVRVSWGDSDIRCPRYGVPVRKAIKGISLTGWQGERVYAQAFVWSEMDSAVDITYSLSDLKARSGAEIKASDCETGFVMYVMSEDPSQIIDGCYKGYMGEKVTQYDSMYVADRIDPYLESVSLQPRQAQGIWITCPIPSNGYAGSYHGSLTVEADGKVVGVLDIEVKATGRVLPPPSEWSFHLDLWQNVFTPADYAGVEYWSEEHLEVLRPMMKRLADAGQKVITTTIMYMPWGRNMSGTTSNFTSMITWVRRADGSWEFIYDVFDRFVEFMISCGIDEQIALYTMLPWQYRFMYYDQASNSMKDIVAHPDTKEFEDLWVTFLRDMAAHLREKGWFEKAVIASDERPLAEVRRCIEVVRMADPEFKISIAGFEHLPEIDAEIYDYSLASYKDFPEDMLAQRRAKGQKSTYYICCPEIHPNTYVFSDPIESVYIPYNMYVRGVDGFLRWAVFHWMGDISNDARWDNYYSGEIVLLYPDNNTSIRFEKLVEGIQDFEKIRILKKEYEEAGEERLLEELDKALEPFRMMAYPKDRYNIRNRYCVSEAVARVQSLLNR